MVEFVTSYHKGWSASKKSKIVHRYVPYEIGKLVVYGMWLLEPVDPSNCRIWSTGRRNSARLYGSPNPRRIGEDGAVEDDDVDDDSRTCNSPDDDEWSEGEIRPVGSAPTAKNVDGFWDTDRLRRVMRRETRKRDRRWHRGDGLASRVSGDPTGADNRPQRP